MNSMWSPEFFDLFGFLGFVFIFSISLWGIKTKKPMPQKAVFLLLIIGILGLIIDGTIVYTTFAR